MKVGSGSFGIYPYIEGKSIASQLNSACAQAAGEGTRTLNSGFGNAGSTVGTTFATGFKNAVAGIGKIATAAIGVAAAGATALVKSAVNSYAEYEQLVGGVETLFKSSSDRVIQYANNAYQTAGMSANQYMDTVVKFSASLLQGLGGDTEKATTLSNLAITDMADNANKMGTAIESIQWAYQGFAKQNYTMLDNLRLGYGGTKSEMERLVRDAGVVKREFKSLDEITFAEMIESIHEIQTRLGITGTTAYEAATTIQGSLNMTKAAWANLKTAMADPSQDVSVWVDAWIQAAGTLAKNVIPKVEQAFKSISKVIDELAPVIAEKLPGLVQSILPSLINAATQIAASLAAQLPSIIGSVMTSLGQTITSSNPFGGLLVAGTLTFGTLNKAAGLFGGSLGSVVTKGASVAAKGISALVSKAKGLTDFSGVIGDLAPLREANGALNATATNSSKAAKGVSGLGNAAQSAGSKVSSGFKQMAGSALQIAAIGAAVALAGVGFKLMAEGAAQIGQAGGGAIAAIAIMGATLVGFAAVVATLGSGLTAAAGGILALGAAVLLAGVGFMAMAQGCAAIGAAGGGAIAALAIMSVTLIGLVVVLALFAPALVVATPFVLAFGAAILMAGVGIGAATAGIALMVNSITGLVGALPIAAQYGMQAAAAFVMIGGSLVIVAAGCVTVAAGFLAMAASLLAVIPTLGIVAAELVVFDAAMVIAAASTVGLAGAFLVAAGGAAALGAVISGIRGDCEAAVGAMWGLQGSVDTVGNSISALGGIVDGTVSWIQSAFEGLANNATNSLNNMWNNMVAGCYAGGGAVVAACAMIVESANSTFRNLGDEAYWAGVRVGQSFADGIRSQLGNVSSAASSLKESGKPNALTSTGSGYSPQVGGAESNANSFAAVLNPIMSRTRSSVGSSVTSGVAVKSDTYNIYIDGMKLNDDAEMNSICMQFAKKLRRVEAM